jgi:hypothetical protein
MWKGMESVWGVQAQESRKLKNKNSKVRKTAERKLLFRFVATPSATAMCLTSWSWSGTRTSAAAFCGGQEAEVESGSETLLCTYSGAPWNLGIQYRSRWVANANPPCCLEKA